jgi:ABC-2 family transporter protein
VADVFRALLRKEWREQRWRFFLGTMVLSGLLAGLLRAQIVPSLEAAVLIYGPVGLLLVIFLAAAPIAGERADRTWEFLVAQPVSRYDVLRAKWAMGVIQLAGTMVTATAAGLLAMWSRGFRVMPRTPWSDASTGYDALVAWWVTHPALSLCAFAAVATIGLICWFTPLCLLLARAHNEFTAALGGVLLSVALLLWLAEFSLGSKLLLVTALFNPLSPLVLIFGWSALLTLVTIPAHLAIWVVLPLWCARHDSGRMMEKWMGT